MTPQFIIIYITIFAHFFTKTDAILCVYQPNILEFNSEQLNQNIFTSKKDITYYFDTGETCYIFSTKYVQLPIHYPVNTTRIKSWIMDGNTDKELLEKYIKHRQVSTDCTCFNINFYSDEAKSGSIFVRMIKLFVLLVKISIKLSIIICIGKIVYNLTYTLLECLSKILDYIF